MAKKVPPVLDERQVASLARSCAEKELYITTTIDGISHSFEALLDELKNYRNLGGVYAHQTKVTGWVVDNQRRWPVFEEAYPIHEVNVRQLIRLYVLYNTAQHDRYRHLV